MRGRRQTGKEAGGKSARKYGKVEGETRRRDEWTRLLGYEAKKRRGEEERRRRGAKENGGAEREGDKNAREREQGETRSERTERTERNREQQGGSERVPMRQTTR